MSQATVGTLRGKALMPSLTVNDLNASLKFFEGLGFEVEDRWENDGVLLGVMLKAGECRLGINQDDGKKGKDRAKGVGFRLYIEADGDIDQAAAHAKANGVTLSKEPHDTSWGTRAFEAIEPSGYQLTIASPSKS